MHKCKRCGHSCPEHEGAAGPCAIFRCECNSCVCDYCELLKGGELDGNETDEREEDCGEVCGAR